FEANIKMYKSELKSPKDIIDILNGTIKDISPLTVWIKTLYNSSDPLIGSISKLIQRHSFDVENRVISEGQILGEQVEELKKKYGVTDEDIRNNLIVT